MSRLAKQFVAVMLTIWLPLFSGNALAVSIAMQWTAGGCETGMALPADAHEAGQMMHAGHDAQADQVAGDCGMPMDADGAICVSCDVCHLANSGYLAAVTVEVAAAPQLAAAYPAYTSRFQSVSLIPLDPPPLARA